MDLETPRGKCSSRKRKATPAEKDNSTSIWDENFPFGVFIDKHFITEKDREKYEEWGLEKCFRISQAAPIQLDSIARWMGLKVGDLKNSCRDHVEENTKLKNKLSESENNIGELKRKLEELILEKSGLMEKEEDLKNEISKTLAKLHREESIVYNLKAENEELKAKVEDLKDENAGYNKAVIQFLTSIPNLKP